MQGQGAKSWRWHATLWVFACMFVTSAFAAFGLAFGAGSLLGVGQAPAIVGFILLLLAAVDLVSLYRKSYCPISLSRQTPKTLLRKLPFFVAVPIWGLDTGFVVTTFRVSAATWGAITLAICGFGDWKLGLAYGLAFTLPLLVCICWLSISGRLTSQLLVKTLGFRAPAQFASFAILLIGAASLLFGR